MSVNRCRAVLCLYAVVGTPKTDRPGWARGPGRHGGGAVAMCGRPLMLALNFWSFCFKTKGQDNRSHRCPPTQARHGSWNHKKTLTESIRNIRKVWARFGSFRLETEITEGMTWLLEPRLGMTFFLNPAATEVLDYLS